jgi:multiple antibiotic resistance protein
MAVDILTFSLLSVSSMIIIVNPLSTALVFVSLTETLERSQKLAIARDSCRYALGILLVFTLAGGWILQLFGITLEAFRIAGGILLFGIGMEMVYARLSRTRLTATEKYERRDDEDIAVMPLATPMITGPGAITTGVVLMNEAAGLGGTAVGVVIVSVVLAIFITFYMLKHSDQIVNHIGQREYRAVNRLMGMLLIAIAVQFVITGLKEAFPVLMGG